MHISRVVLPSRTGFLSDLRVTFNSSWSTHKQSQHGCCSVNSVQGMLLFNSVSMEFIVNRFQGMCCSFNSVCLDVTMRTLLTQILQFHLWHQVCCSYCNMSMDAAVVDVGVAVLTVHTSDAVVSSVFLNVVSVSGQEGKVLSFPCLLLKHCSQSKDWDEHLSLPLSNFMKQFFLLRTDVRRLVWSCLSAGERVKVTISALQLTNTASASLMVVEPPAGWTDDQQQTQRWDLIIFRQWRVWGDEFGVKGGVGAAVGFTNTLKPFFYRQKVQTKVYLSVATFAEANSNIEGRTCGRVSLHRCRPIIINSNLGSIFFFVLLLQGYYRFFFFFCENLSDRELFKAASLWENFDSDTWANKQVDRPRAQEWLDESHTPTNHSKPFEGTNPSTILAAKKSIGVSANRTRKRNRGWRRKRRRMSSRQGRLIQCYFHSHFSSHWICLPVFLAIDFQLNEPATPSTQHAHRLPTFTHHNRSMRHFSTAATVSAHTQKTDKKKWCKYKNTEAKKAKKEKKKVTQQLKRKVKQRTKKKKHPKMWKVFPPKKIYTAG